MPDNTRFLRAAEQQRRARLIDQARQAIQRLDASAQPVTVVAVVRASGVSRAFLYRTPELIDQIQRLRDRQQQTGQRQPARQRMTDVSKEARIRQLTEINTRLRTEIAQLRDQNARLLGRLREHTAQAHSESPSATWS
jgi:aspartokinase